MFLNPGFYNQVNLFIVLIKVQTKFAHLYNMHFLFPAFLFALAALAIPVIIHLFNFRRYQKVYFSNVQFLKEIQEQQSSLKNLKERLILASRMLALAFLILA